MSRQACEQCIASTDRGGAGSAWTGLVH